MSINDCLSKISLSIYRIFQIRKSKSWKNKFLTTIFIASACSAKIFRPFQSAFKRFLGTKPNRSLAI